MRSVSFVTYRQQKENAVILDLINIIAKNRDSLDSEPTLENPAETRP